MKSDTLLIEERRNKKTELETIVVDNEKYFKISNVDEMRPFFMSIVSDSNHWMFISSNGGITAGRKNADYALFPYYTEDKLTESTEITGSKTIISMEENGIRKLWEPFSIRNEGLYNVSRNLYKNIYGNKVIFQEINHDLKLTFSYQWSSSNRFGFVRKAKITNNSESTRHIELIDGIQNIMPHGVPNDLQNGVSNLVDAYKRNELDQSTGLGIYALSAIIVDRAEPSEALKANIAWSLGLENVKYLVSSLQLSKFRKGVKVTQESDVKAERGAYFVTTELSLEASEFKRWMIVANVNQNHSSIAEVSHLIRNEDKLEQLVSDNIELGTQRLIGFTTSSDGLQLTADSLMDTRHYSNTLFNIMRGGIFDDNYKIEREDLLKYLKTANKEVYKYSRNIIQNLPDIFNRTELNGIIESSENKDFQRLCIEYLPLKFSRRHGDPSRPWNWFSIETRNEVDGSKILDYQGNWRDIFQNWEALAHSFPDFIEGMICKFLNASTFDGYNPYRVVKDGFDWEIIEPDDPWSYIGYWGDHQIIYLLKFLEFCENHYPQKLEAYFNREIFVYANVPYKIRSYEDIVKNSKDTIIFDDELDKYIREKRTRVGTDGALMFDENNAIYKVNFIEKILATLLAKMSNYLPDGGIWMNTQRPEWNDANNALVGNGVSMVTLYYLRRFLNFFKEILDNSSSERFKVSNELILFYRNIDSTLEKYQHLLDEDIDEKSRRKILDDLGKAGSEYRSHVYKQGFWGKKRTISISGLKRFVELAQKYLEHSIRRNKRKDGLYHAYNLLTLDKSNEVEISYLSEMLEGQVAVLSSGYLSSKESLELLDALKDSSLFRDDQYSYILYPNKDLPGFLERNNVPEDLMLKSSLLVQLLSDEDTSVIEKDRNNKFHFNGNFKNAEDLSDALVGLDQDKYGKLVTQERALILDIFEEMFNHKAFTGRSGTFYGYEGLGSIYWHMVSKLQLAVQECCIKAINDKESEETIGRLLEHYYEIKEGIGVHKSPELYGAFPTDPYSHTPATKGAQQPGMTGQVKEDILSRMGELGVFVKEGRIYFNPCLLRKSEFLKQENKFIYLNINNEKKEIEINENSVCFTYCQVPIIYTISTDRKIEIYYGDNRKEEQKGFTLNQEASTKIFNRTGAISKIQVYLLEVDLK